MVFFGGGVIDWKDNFANRVLQKLCTTHFWQSTNWCLSTIINDESPIRKKSLLLLKNYFHVVGILTFWMSEPILWLEAQVTLLLGKGEHRPQNL